MIKGFVHKGLKRFYSSGSNAGIQAKHTDKLRLILAQLDNSENVTDMDIPRLNLHQLKGNRKDIWSVTVQTNWRITFSFEEGDAEVVNYENHH
jgi:proteic killer suppression protein